MLFPMPLAATVRIHRELKWEFDFAQRVFWTWYSPPQKPVIFNKLHPSVQNTAQAIDIQISRHFLAACEECFRGEAISANILCRSMFESNLALLWVLRPRISVALLTRSTLTGSIRHEVQLPTKKHAPHKKHLPRLLRAQAYIFHSFLREATFANRLKDAGTHRLAQKLSKDPLNKEIIDEMEKMIGPEWTYILIHSHNYAGLKIEQIARLLGKKTAWWYRVMYSLQSEHVHANSSRYLHTLDGDDAVLSMMSDPAHIRSALEVACTLFIESRKTIAKYVGFDHTVEHRVTELERELMGHYNSVDD